MGDLPTVIRFFGQVAEKSTYALMDAIDNKMKQGQHDFILLMSTPGGSVFHGLSAYNYLKGIPANVTTHNFGSVESIGVVLFCAGKKRLSVPQAHFLLHGVKMSFPHDVFFEEPQLGEKMKALRMDAENISKVVADITQKKVEDVVAAMLTRTTLNPEEAQKWGLVNEIKAELFQPGSEVITIQG